MQDDETIRRLSQIENKIDSQVLRQIEDLKAGIELSKNNNMLLGGISSKLDNITKLISAGIDDVRSTTTKVIFALIGLVGATIGVKFIGSPAWLDVYGFTIIAILLFVMLEAAHRKIWLRFLSGVGFFGYVVFSLASIDRSVTSNMSLPVMAYYAIISFSIGVIFLAASSWKGRA